MHPEILKDAPGNCPKCGMNLVPVKEDKSTHKEHHEHHAHTQMYKPVSSERSGNESHAFLYNGYGLHNGVLLTRKVSTSGGLTLGHNKRISNLS